MNEERILEYLKSMEARIDSRFENLENAFTEMKQEQAEMKQEQSEMKQAQSETNQRLDRIEQDQAEMKKDQAEMKKEQAEMKKEQAETNQRLGKIETGVAYSVQRAESASHSVALIEVEHGQKIGALFDKIDLVYDLATETNEIVKALWERQEHQSLQIAWHDSRLKEASL